MRLPEFSLQARLFAGVALILGAATATPILFLPSRLEVQDRKAVEHRAQDVARAMASALQAPLDFRDQVRAAEVLRGLSAARGATYAALQDAGGTTLATWGSPPQTLQGAPGGGALFYRDDLLHVSVPVESSLGEPGLLRVGVALGELRERQGEARALVGATAAVIFAAGLVAAFALGTVLTGPLRRIGNLAARIARGEHVASRDLTVSGGQEVGAVATALETVLDRLTAQRAFLESQSEASSEGILTLDQAGRVLTHNRRFCDLWGLPEDSVRGAHWDGLRAAIAGRMAGPLPSWLEGPVPELPSTAAARSFELILRNDVYVAGYAAAVQEPSGQVLGLGLYFRDLSEMKRAEAQVRSLNADLERRVEERTRELAQRLDDLRQTQQQLVVADRRISLGRLAAGVAHEINNPLAYVVANLRFAAGGLPGVRESLDLADPAALASAASAIDEMIAALTDAADGVDRVAHIVRSLKAFSRSEDEHRSPVRLERVAEMALGMAAHEIRHRAGVRRAYQPAPRVLADEVRLSQVVLNLLINAAQSIQPGAADRNSIGVAVGTTEDGLAFAEVTDTGCGIPAEVRSRIFDPFFTTKAQGEGTGLGLSISHGIVNSLGGRFEVESEVGRGSRFRIVLPPCAAADHTPAAPTPARAAAGSGGRILVVDDEPKVASTIQRILGKDHHVEVELRAAQALVRIRRGERFDLVLCDLMMPEMTGMEFYAQLERIEPAQASRVTFVTGGAFTEATSAFMNQHQRRCIGKPFDPDTLRSYVLANLQV